MIDDDDLRIGKYADCGKSHYDTSNILFTYYVAWLADNRAIYQQTKVNWKWTTKFVKICKDEGWIRVFPLGAADWLSGSKIERRNHGRYTRGTAGTLGRILRQAPRLC